jgi:predicted anti-sigma-YlaC factor YlaD
VTDCEFLKENLIDFTEKKLDAESSARLTQHLKLCRNCRELARAFAAIWQSSDQVESIEPSPEFWAKLQSRLDTIDAVRKQKPLPARFLPLLRPAVAFAAVAVAVLLGYSFGHVPISTYSTESSEVGDLWSEYGFELFDRFPEGSLPDVYFELSENGGDES